MIEVRQTLVFRRWLAELRDSIAVKAVKAIKRRIVRVQAGLFGDAKAVGSGVFELRVNHGPGYRVYFARRGDLVVLLVCGGDKASQARDIVRARDLVAEWMED